MSHCIYDQPPLLFVPPSCCWSSLWTTKSSFLCLATDTPSHSQLALPEDWWVVHTQQRHTPSRLQWTCSCFLCQEKTFQLSHNICYRATVFLKSPTGSQTMPSGFFCSRFQHILQLVCSRWIPAWKELGDRCRGSQPPLVAHAKCWRRFLETGPGFPRAGWRWQTGNGAAVRLFLLTWVPLSSP